MQRFYNGFLVAVAGLLGAAGASAGPTRPASQPSDAAAVRGWILTVYDMPYLRGVLDTAPRYGINQIQLSHEIVHFADQVLDDPQRQRHVQELVAIGKSHDLEMLIWTHELHNVPDRFRVGVDNRVNLDDPDLWDWLRERYERLYDVVPDLDGVVVSLSETGPASVVHERGVISIMQRQQRVAKIAEVLNAVSEPRGKRVVLRDFGETLWARQGIRLCPPGVWAMTKVVFGDWQPYGEHSITYDYYGDRPLLVEFDLCGEYMGQAVIPWADPAYVKYRWDYARKAGNPAGGVARIDRTEFHKFKHVAFGTPNEINIEMFCRLMRDPNTSPDAVWKEWTTKRYGEEAAPHVEAALRRSAELTRKLYWGDRLGDYRIQCHSFIPTFSYALSHNEPYMQTYPVDAELFVRDPGLIEREMSRRYDDIRTMGLASLEDLERAKPYLSADDYEDLQRRFGAAGATALAFKTVHTAFIRYLAVELATERRDIYQDALDQLSAEARTDFAEIERVARIIERDHSDLDLASPARLRAFYNGLEDAYDTLKRRMGAP